MWKRLWKKEVNDQNKPKQSTKSHSFLQVKIQLILVWNHFRHACHQPQQQKKIQLNLWTFVQIWKRNPRPRTLCPTRKVHRPRTTNCQHIKLLPRQQLANTPNQIFQNIRFKCVLTDPNKLDSKHGSFSNKRFSFSEGINNGSPCDKKQSNPANILKLKLLESISSSNECSGTAEWPIRSEAILHGSWR